MASRPSDGQLESLPSGSTDLYLYESAEDSVVSHSRASSFSARRRSSEAAVSRTSSAASVRASLTDTASSPERRPSSRGAAATPRSAGALGGRSVPAAAAGGADAVTERLQEVSLEDQNEAPTLGSGADARTSNQQQQQQQQRQVAAEERQQQQQGAAAGPAAAAKEAQPGVRHPEQAVEPGATPAAAAAAAGLAGPAAAKVAAAAAQAPAPTSRPSSAPATAAAAPASPPPPGAALFSVPMASAPTTGIYGIPQEMFRIRDLDAGREYSLDQRYWIKDMDTGNVYVLEAEAEPGAPAGTSGAPAGEGRVTELLSGRELSQGEFEDALGFFKVPQPAPPPPHMLPGTTSSDQLGAAGAAVQHAAQKSMKSFTTGATWVKASVGGMISSLKQGSPRGSGERGDSGGSHGPGSPGLTGGALAGGGGSSVVPPSTLDDRQGQPVKVQVYRKSYREFTDMRLVQQLGGHQGVVWTMKFSRNGRYLASAGQDCVIRVWDVATSRGAGSTPGSPLESDIPLDDASTAAGAVGSSGGVPGPDGSALLADPAVAVFQQRPCRVYTGHKQDVLDLCWSKTQFLLSASMDKTVRLWHASMDECLRVFKHTDFVTAIDFHPMDDKMFLSGSIDGKVRLWNIPEQRVVSWQDVHEMVTAVTFSLDGRKAVVGTMKGKCRFYTLEKNSLEYEAQLDVKNKRGQHSRGKKITGLAFLPSEPGKLLITSNDSRVRLYDGYTLRCKYKGHTNRNTQIRASFSPDGDYITCGSDDGWVYVWGTRKSEVPPSGAGGGGAGSAFQREPDNPLAKEKNASYECFQANGDIVTVAIFAPTSCHRSAESMSPTADASRHQRSNSLGDQAEGEVALATARARGQVLVTAGYTGEIRVYENIGLPQWL